MEHTLFDSATPTIKQETEYAIQKGFKNADEHWKYETLENMHKFCQYTAEFTMNDFRAYNAQLCKVQTHDNRAMGGIVKRALKEGWIEGTGRSIISRVGHGVPLQIWKSLILIK